MITVQNSGLGNVYVGTEGEEMAVQVPGSFYFKSISYVRAGTNAPTDLDSLYPDLHDGAVIVPNHHIHPIFASLLPKNLRHFCRFSTAHTSHCHEPQRNRNPIQPLSGSKRYAILWK